MYKKYSISIAIVPCGPNLHNYIYIIESFDSQNRWKISHVIDVIAKASYQWSKTAIIFVPMIQFYHLKAKNKFCNRRRRP